MSTDLLIKILKKVSFFDGVDSRTLSFIAHCAELIKAERDETIFLEGDPSNCMYVIVTGKVMIYCKGKDGENQTLNIITNSALIGEMSLLDGHARSASAKTLEETIMFCISRSDFQIFLQNNFPVALKIIETLSSRLRATNEIVENNCAIV